MAAYSPAGRIPLVIWAAAVDPADVPIMRSASVRSTPASATPAMRPSSHALPAAPARREPRLACLSCPPVLRRRPAGPVPASSSCRGVRVTAMPSEVVGELMRGVGEGAVFTGSRLSRIAYRALPVTTTSVARSCPAGSTHYRHCVHGSHLLPVEHDDGNARTLATRCAIGIKFAAHGAGASVLLLCSGRTARLRPGREGEQPLAGHQRGGLARQPVRAHRHETVVADVECLLAEARLP